MQRRHVDLHGLTLAEAEVKVRKFIDEIQEEALENYEVMLVDLGPIRTAADLARHQAELVDWREQEIGRMLGMAEREGKSFQ